MIARLGTPHNISEVKSESIIERLMSFMSLPRYTFVFESEIAEHTCMSKYHQLSSSYHAHLWFSTTLQSNRSPVPMKGAMCVLYQEQSMVPNTCNSVGPTILTDLNHLSDQVQKGSYEGKDSGPLRNYPFMLQDHKTSNLFANALGFPDTRIKDIKIKAFPPILLEIAAKMLP